MSISLFQKNIQKPTCACQHPKSAVCLEETSLKIWKLKPAKRDGNNTVNKGEY